MAQKAKKYRPKPIPKHERKRKKRVSPKPTTALATRQAPPVSEAIEKVLIGGDLNPLSPEQRIDYMKAVCKSLGLNPLTQPFSYILFKETENAPAKLVLYARKDCAEQLRKIHGVSVLPGMTKRTMDDDFATVEVSVRDKWGKTDTATGMVYLWSRYQGKQYRLTGQRLADAVLKAETKAKRRATLSVCGLGILDEHDLDSLRVVGGITPEGRTFEYVPTAEAREAAQTVLQDKLSGKRPLHTEEAPEEPAQPRTKAPKASATSEPAAPLPASQDSALPQITLDWSVDEASPRLIGDSEIIERLKPDIHASWGKDSFWHCEPRDAETIRRLQHTFPYKLLEVLPKQDSSSGAKAPGGTTPSPGGDAHGKRSGSSDAKASGTSGQPAPAVDWMEGVVDQVNPGTGKSPSLNILFAIEPKKKFWLGCFDQTLFPFISKAAGMKCQFVVQKRKSGDKTYTNIIGIKHIGNTHFDDDGKTPVIQQSKREAGGRTLWE